MKNVRFSFLPFFRLLSEKGYSDEQFIYKYNHSRNLIYRLKNNCNVTITTLLQLMVDLDVDDINKIIEIKIIR